jgi:hypothetical protein
MISNIQAQQKPIVKGGGIVESLFIQDQGTRKGTNFQELMPIAGIARKSRDFQPQDQPHVSQSYLGDKPLEPKTISS